MHLFRTLLLLDFLPFVFVCLPGIFEQEGIETQFDPSRLNRRYPEDWAERSALLNWPISSSNLRRKRSSKQEDVGHLEISD